MNCAWNMITVSLLLFSVICILVWRLMIVSLVPQLLQQCWLKLFHIYKLHRDLPDGDCCCEVLTIFSAGLHLYRAAEWPLASPSDRRLSSCSTCPAAFRLLPFHSHWGLVLLGTLTAQHLSVFWTPALICNVNYGSLCSEPCLINLCFQLGLLLFSLAVMNNRLAK